MNIAAEKAFAIRPGCCQGKIHPLDFYLETILEQGLIWSQFVNAFACAGEAAARVGPSSSLRGTRPLRIEFQMGLIDQSPLDAPDHSSAEWISNRFGYTWLP
jgi:hypothetical protein